MTYRSQLKNLHLLGPFYIFLTKGSLTITLFLKIFHNLSSLVLQLDEEEDYFNPDYVEVDRVLDESVVRDPTTDADVTHYLVKWQSLPYEDSTWELEKDVDSAKVAAYRKFKELPVEEEDRVVSLNNFKIKS